MTGRYFSCFIDDEIPDPVDLDDEFSDEERPAQRESPPPQATPPLGTPLPLPPQPPPPAAALGATPVAVLPEAQEDDATVNLDSDTLNLLGEDHSNKKCHGVSLHKDIAPRWTHILTNGLAKDTQTDLVKQYLPPENCANMSAPKLNPEIKAALSDLNIKQDQYCQGKQNQLGSGLAALGQVLNWTLTSKNIVPPNIIKALSDAGRLICDNHYRESLSRRYAVLNALNKNIRDTVKDTKIDENLFGSNLSDHIKSSKAITKTASEMKTSRAPYQALPAAHPQRGALNSRGIPRAVAIEPRTAPAPRRPPPPPAPRDRRQPPATSRGRQRTAGYPRQQRRR